MIFRRADQIWRDLPPGQFPPPGTHAEIARVRPGREYRGTIPVDFSPPPGLGPGLIGTVVDGEAHLHDVTAMILDLAVRGWLTLTQIPGAGRRGRPGWELRRNPHPPADRLDPLESELLQVLFPGTRRRVRMSELAAGGGRELRRIQEGLYAAAVTLGWYPKHPRKGWRRVPRTAAGTAVRIRALGFREYLTTAEAGQLRFEEAAHIFSRYLPYAVVFGVATIWAKTFADVVARAEARGVDLSGFEIAWLAGDLLSVGGDIVTLATAAGSAAELAGEVGSITEAVGEFVGGIGELLDVFT